MYKLIGALTGLLLLVIVIAGCSSGGQTEAPETSTTVAAQPVPSEESTEVEEAEDVDLAAAKVLFETKCTACHGWDEPGLLQAEGKNAALKGQFLKHPKRSDWKDTVTRMKTNGMEATDAEFAQITAYLNAKWGS